MKSKLFYLGASLALLASCSPDGPRTIDNPIINFANTRTIDIVGVDLNDSTTVVNVNAYYQPGYWIKIAGETVLRADGKEYALTGAEGITPDSLFWMPESGEANFSLTFEPLPYSTKSFDFIEGNEPGAFKLLDVDITGKTPDVYPKGLPGELKKEPKIDQIPEPALAVGTTELKLHLLPFLPEFSDKDYSLYVNNMDDTQNEISVKFDENGVATVSIDQYGIANAFLVSDGALIADFHLYPGETVDCYVDMRFTGQIAMSNRDDVDVSTFQRSYSNGKYGDFDRITNVNIGDYKFLLYSGKFADFHMTGAEYKQHVKNLYDSLNAKIDSADLLPATKEYARLTLQNNVLEAFARYKYLLKHNYQYTYRDWRNRIPEDSIPGTLGEEDFAEVTGWFEINNPKLLTISNSMGEMDWNRYGVEGDLSRSVNLFMRYAQDAKNGTIKDAVRDSLKALSNPFFAAAIDSIGVQNKRKLEQLSKNATVTPIPDVANDKLFDAIIAPHRGKVVVVDLWNTWCGPCRGALKANEPLKTGELSSDDIVWIYIADESSDAIKYAEMIPEIKGIHYKVNAEQINTIRDRFEVDGIPYYILVDRNGKAAGRPDLRDHSKYVSEIKGLL